MSRKSCFAMWLLAGGITLAGAILSETVVRAQGKGAAPEAAKITTVDGVKLNSLFYPSAKKNPATVLMLHPIGDGKSMKAQEWKRLAEVLQSNGYAVMMFDFRGHGESTTVIPADFWKYAQNKSWVRTKEKEEIDVKDYIKNGAYLPVLANDIAAVRSYLDRKNDTGACNTSNLIVIGADNGATLGVLWINSEWYRYKYTPPAFGKPQEVAKRAEGNDIIAAIFLTIQPNLGPTRAISVSGVLKTACKDHAMATAFFYGKEDEKAKVFNKGLELRLKVKDKKKYDYTVLAEWNTPLSGVKLLQKDLKTDDWIVRYLENVVAERGNEWTQRNFQEAYYIWRIPSTGQTIPAKNRKGELNLNFDSYDKFITQ